MKSLRVGTDVWVNADDILLVMPFDTRAAGRQKHTAKGKGLFVDASEGGTSRSILVLRNGTVVSSASHAETLVSRPLINPPCRASVRETKADAVSATMQASIADIEGGE